MSFDEALDWLDERGGGWTMRASRSAVAVIVTLGGRQVQTTVEQLRAEEIRSALVKTVQRLRSMLAAT